MSQPPIKGDGLRRTVLEWSAHGSCTRSVWVGCLCLNAGEYVHDCWWSVNPGNRSNYGREGQAETLIEAQLAAESAARDLLCSALAAFADDAPEVAVSYQPADGAWRAGVPAEMFAKVEPGTARRLALALLRAAGTKEG